MHKFRVSEEKKEETYNSLKHQEYLSRTSLRQSFSFPRSDPSAEPPQSSHSSHVHHTPEDFSVVSSDRSYRPNEQRGKRMQKRQQRTASSSLQTFVQWELEEAGEQVRACQGEE